MSAGDETNDHLPVTHDENTALTLWYTSYAIGGCCNSVCTAITLSFGT